MAWLIIHVRQREQLLAAARDGAAEFTTDARQALKFDSADAARKWMDRNLVSALDSLALMRDAPDPEHPRRGQVGHYRPRTYC